jgi:hypothetical protein
MDLDPGFSPVNMNGGTTLLTCWELLNFTSLFDDARYVNFVKNINKKFLPEKK